MYILGLYYVRMVRRTTLEIDQELLGRAQRALGLRSIRATVEEALRRVSDAAEQEEADRSARQQGFLARLGTYVDSQVLASEEMWQ